MVGLKDKWQQGLKKTRRGVFSKISQLLKGKQCIDGELLDELEGILIEGDLGAETALRIIESIKEVTSLSSDYVEDTVRSLLKEQILGLVEPSENSREILSDEKPHVISIVGVNGTGKTTTIGKLAKRFQQDGKKVVLAGADTFRAAAGEQLEVWAKRACAELVRQSPGADPASVAYDALEAAHAREVDVLIVDTAGRLHTKVNLMEELKKIHRVLACKMSSAPHEVLLVLDATTGQNGMRQAKLFSESVGVTGIVLTKLDGTAKGGIVVAIRKTLGIPVKWVGIGEGIDDLIAFDAQAFVDGLFERE